MDTADFHHTPVLGAEVVAWMPQLAGGGTFIDCTAGGGGHSELILDRYPAVEVVAVDQDEDALAAARRRLGRFEERVTFSKANFGDLETIADDADSKKIAGILYDLGVSSPQLDRAERGFGYRFDARLDMRMDRSQPLDAEKVVNTYPEKQLAQVIASYGEERFARRIAKAIAQRRSREPIRLASDLAEVIKTAIPAPGRRTGPHPARRTFQAIRIEVNRELDSLQESLPKAVDLLTPGGRVAVISYHSLEDRIAKRTFAEFARGCTCPPQLPICVCGRNATIRVLTKKPMRAGAHERAANPRSGSARLRVAEKLEGGGV